MLYEGYKVEFVSLSNLVYDNKTIEYKIDKIRRDLKNAENDLRRVGNNIDLKLVGYKNALQMKIDLLNDEYNLSVERMNLISNE
jgi:hypothetical protein